MTMVAREVFSANLRVASELVAYGEDQFQKARNRSNFSSAYNQMLL